jgi:hypothetical protein
MNATHMATNRTELYDFWIEHGFFDSVAKHLERAFYHYTVKELIHLPKENILFMLKDVPEIQKHHQSIVLRVLEDERLLLLRRNKNTRKNSPMYFFWIDGHFSHAVALMLEHVFWFADVNTLLAMSDDEIIRKLYEDPVITDDIQRNAFVWVKHIKNRYQ